VTVTADARDRTRTESTKTTWVLCPPFVFERPGQPHRLEGGIEEPPEPIHCSQEDLCVVLDRDRLFKTVECRGRHVVAVIVAAYDRIALTEDLDERVEIETVPVEASLPIHPLSVESGARILSLRSDLLPRFGAADHDRLPARHPDTGTHENRHPLGPDRPGHRPRARAERRRSSPADTPPLCAADS
jgi:hypothetical protein